MYWLDGRFYFPHKNSLADLENSSGKTIMHRNPLVCPTKEKLPKNLDIFAFVT